MKFLKYALIVPLLFGCNSKNNSIEVLKQNEKEYKTLAQTYAYRSNSVIVFMEFKGNKIDIKLIEKNQDENVDIVECKVNKVSYTPKTIPSKSEKRYLIELQKYNRSIKLSCKLSNNENIKFRMRSY